MLLALLLRHVLAKPVGDEWSSAVFHSRCGRFAEKPVDKWRALLGDQALGTAC
jgi:hypothetical protein